MKYFCSKCGKTTAYNLELPKFCSACGQSFASTSRTSSVSSKSIPTNVNKNELKFKENINSRNIEDDILYNSEYTPIPNESQVIKTRNFKNIKPAFKIDLYKPSNETFGSLIDNPSKPLENNDIQFNNINKSHDEILTEFQREAGSLRQNE
jgi:ribosomal protein L37E